MQSKHHFYAVGVELSCGNYGKQKHTVYTFTDKRSRDVFVDTLKGVCEFVVIRSITGHEALNHYKKELANAVDLPTTQTDIKPFDIVRLRTNWSEPSERSLLYAVKAVYPESQRCDILCLTTNLAIAPIETVSLNMIENVWGLNIQDLKNFKLTGKLKR